MKYVELDIPFEDEGFQKALKDAVRAAVVASGERLIADRQVVIPRIPVKPEPL